MKKVLIVGEILITIDAAMPALATDLSSLPMLLRRPPVDD
jgi:hypothetical protein